MNESALETAVDDDLICPTCNARQPWSDECRRCKCDLSLLRQYWSACETQRRRCLRELRRGRPDAALDHASRYAALAGTPRASRLLAVCHLLCRDWANALAVDAIQT